MVLQYTAVSLQRAFKAVKMVVEFLFLALQYCFIAYQKSIGLFNQLFVKITNLIRLLL